MQSYSSASSSDTPGGSHSLLFLEPCLSLFFDLSCSCSSVDNVWSLLLSESSTRSTSTPLSSCTATCWLDARGLWSVLWSVQKSAESMCSAQACLFTRPAAVKHTGTSRRVAYMISSHIDVLKRLTEGDHLHRAILPAVQLRRQYAHTPFTFAAHYRGLGAHMPASIRPQPSQSAHWVACVLHSVRRLRESEFVSHGSLEIDHCMKVA